MAYYARFYSKLPTSFLVARSASIGEIRRFDTIVDARRHGAKLLSGKHYKNGVVMIYSKNVDNYLYAINDPLSNPDLLGFVSWNEGMGWNYWNTVDTKDKYTKEIYFRSRPIYKNGKLAGRN